jgi:hypothetical protein
MYRNVETGPYAGLFSHDSYGRGVAYRSGENARVARARLLALVGILAVSVPFFLPWPFLAPPHGTRFYEIAAQVFPVLVLAWVVELRGTLRLNAGAQPGLALLAPLADAVLAVIGEGAALYAAGYGVSNHATFALTAGSLAFFGTRIIARATLLTP